MSVKGFFSDQAKEKVKNAIVEAERSTSAEVVVAVKPSASSYREIDYALGALVALIALCVLMFHPAEFNEDLFPLMVVLAFLFGASLSMALWPLKRALLSKSRRQAEVARAARAAFVDMGVHSTQGRTGILVYLSAFEKQVEVVVDVAVARANLGEAWTAACERVQRAGVAGDVEAFASAVSALGPVLAPALPRAEDDVNELPDEVH